MAKKVIQRIHRTPGTIVQSGDREGCKHPSTSHTSNKTLGESSMKCAISSNIKTQGQDAREP